MPGVPVVSVVDDDASVRVATSKLLRLHGYDVRTFPSAEEFLGSPDRAATRCLIADVVMPGIDGPTLHERLIAQGYAMPVIFISAHAGDHRRAHALKAGAFLSKPFDGQSLIRLVQEALRKQG